VIIFCFALILLSAARLSAIFWRERELTGDERARDDGEEFRYSVERGRGRRVVSISVGFDVPGDLQFTLRPEGVFDPVAKWLHLATEFQTGDRRFDRRIFIDCEDPAVLEELAGNQKLRYLVFPWLSEGTGRRLRCGNGKLWLTTPGGDLPTKEDDRALAFRLARQFLPTVRELRTGLARIGGSGPRDPRRCARRLFVGGIVTCFLAALAGTVNLVEDHGHQMVVAEIPDVAARITFAVTCLFLLALFGRLGSTPRTHNLFADVLLAGLPAIWIASWSGSMYYNQAFDDRPARRVSIPTNGVRAEQGSRGMRYSIDVARWPDARADRHLRLRAREFAIMDGRPCVDIIWREGRLGDPWLERFAPSVQETCAPGVER
jgi:hypothetical protein